MIRIKILLVDDQAFNLKLMRKMIERAALEYPVSIITFSDSLEALEFIRKNSVDVVISDFMMPEVTGKDILLYLRSRGRLKDTIFVIVSAFDEKEKIKECIELGAADFIRKPLDEFEFLPKIKNLVRLSAYMKLQKDRLFLLQSEIDKAVKDIKVREYEIVNRLARVAEERDTNTGNHIVRVGRYSKIIAERVSDDEDFIDMIELSAPLHDVGKIAIPDRILFKPEKLTEEEWEIMKTHTLHGYKMLEGSGIYLLDLAAEIALYHHERWDGKGYPYGLKGESIPLSARIVAIADVFDALTMDRPYKRAWDIEKAIELIRSERGTHFDPFLVDIFLNLEEKVREIYYALKDKKENE